MGEDTTAPKTASSGTLVIVVIFILGGWGVRGRI